MIIQELISAVVGQMDSNGDSFSFLHSDRSWQNLRADEDILPAVYLDMPVKIDTKIVAGGSIQQTYVCTLMFLYESNLDDTPETQYDTLKLAESAMNQFILMVSKDSENFDTSRNIFGQAYQVIAYPVFDRCLDGMVLPFVCTPKQRPAACVPSYSVPVGDCDPVLIKNSNESYSVYEVSGGTRILPDISFTDSDGIVTQVPAVTDIVATPAVPCSGIGGYKGSQPYYTLPSSNACGHAFRFCGRTGGYYSGTGYFDKNGVATTKALAFPNGIIYDTYGVTCDGNLLRFQDQFLLTEVVTLAEAIAFCDSFSLGGLNDWIQMTRDHYDQIRNNDTQYVLDQPPFSNPYPAVELWLNTTFPFAGTDTRAWKLNVYGGEEFAFKTSESGRAFPVGIGNIDEFQLT